MAEDSFGSCTSFWLCSVNVGPDYDSRHLRSSSAILEGAFVRQECVCLLFTSTVHDRITSIGNDTMWAIGHIADGGESSSMILFQLALTGKRRTRHFGFPKLKAFIRLQSDEVRLACDRMLISTES